jgi:hypothetical protein
MSDRTTSLAIELATLEIAEIVRPPAGSGGGLEMLNAAHGMTEMAASACPVSSCCPLCCCCCWD